MEGFSDAEYLPLSGIQHFAFCRRQWALIHLEQQWNENLLTFCGRELHERVDDPTVVEKRGNVITSRAVPVVSHSLRLYGQADVVEFIRDDSGGFELPRYEGLWRVYPVEYKRGKPKSSTVDAVQLCAQAICLEEMLSTEIKTAFIYYGRPRRRTAILLDSSLRKETIDLACEMHEMFRSGRTPAADRRSSCKNCSLVDLCVPRLNESPSVERYVRSFLSL